MNAAPKVTSLYSGFKLALPAAKPGADQALSAREKK